MGVVTRRYTKALYELSDTQGVCDRVWQDLLQMKQWLHNNSDVVRLTRSLVIPRKEAALALGILCEKAQFHDLTTTFIKLLAQHRRLKHLSCIVDSFEQQMDMRAGLVKGHLITAAPLTKTQTNALEKSLSSKLKAQVQLSSNIDPTLLGGFIVRVGSYIVDSCLNTQLIKMQNVLKGKK